MAEYKVGDRVTLLCNGRRGKVVEVQLDGARPSYIVQFSKLVEGCFRSYQLEPSAPVCKDAWKYRFVR